MKENSSCEYGFNMLILERHRTKKFVILNFLFTRFRALLSAKVAKTLLPELV